MNYTKLLIFSIAIILFAACAKPIAQFQTPQQTYQAKTAIKFDNQSQKAEAYEWDFGDGTTSTEATPTHSYKEAGTFTVVLKAKKADKENITQQVIKVTAIPLSADFKMDVKSKVAPAEVMFENLSESAERYVWDFGDYTKSTEENPTHKYRFGGTYTVKLYAIDGGRRKVAEKEVIIEGSESVCLILIETEFGNMTFRLYDVTPRHRDNFVNLVESGFYDGLLFHRVMDGFMIQGGDPDSKNAKPGAALGIGGPGYNIPKEFNSELVHYKGVLAAARQPDNVNPDKESSGSQFYIVQGREVSAMSLTQVERKKGIKYTAEQKSKYKTLGGTAFLDNDYTVFGEIVEGLEVIDKIGATKVDRRNRPVKDVKMTIKTIK
jgi:cyclophilin family peptidyl-prolyl cis-trans isomerase/chitodextrinase